MALDNPKNLSLPPLPLPRDTKLPFHGSEKGRRVPASKVSPQPCPVSLQVLWLSPKRDSRVWISSITPQSSNADRSRPRKKKDLMRRRGKKKHRYLQPRNRPLRTNTPSTDHILGAGTAQTSNYCNQMKSGTRQGWYKTFLRHIFPHCSSSKGTRTNHEGFSGGPAGCSPVCPAR